jgi:hypothetical protein
MHIPMAGNTLIICVLEFESRMAGNAFNRIVLPGKFKRSSIVIEG